MCLPPSLTIPQSLADELLTLAQASPEAEICGLISLQSDSTNSKRLHRQYRVYPVKNITSSPANAFEMDPQQQIHAFREIREQQETLFAIFHSHPHSSAIPSTKDLQDAAYTEVLNIIISLKRRDDTEIRGYYYKDHSAEEVDLIIE